MAPEESSTRMHIGHQKRRDEITTIMHSREAHPVSITRGEGSPKHPPGTRHPAPTFKKEVDSKRSYDGLKCPRATLGAATVIKRPPQAPPPVYVIIAHEQNSKCAPRASLVG